MSSARKIDANGFLTVTGCPISSFGIFDYSAGQLGLDGDPNRIVKVFRPEEAVNNPETIESFQNVPFIIDHEMLSGFDDDNEASAPEDYGMDGVLANVHYEKPWMRGDLKIYSRKAQRALDQGKKDLSLGYTCDFEVKPGVWNGQHYEVVQTNMRGNHIALVDEGRVPGARVLDGRCFDHLNLNVRPSDEETTMAKKTAKRVRGRGTDNAVEQLKALIPALEQFLNEEAQEPEHQDGGEEATPSPAVENGKPNEGDMEPVNADEGGEEGGEEGGGEGNELPALIARARAVLERLESHVNGGGSAEGADGEEDDGANEEAEGEDGHEEGHDEGEESEDMSPIGADAGEEGHAEEGNGRASPGPKKGRTAMGGDAAVQRFYADLAAKDRLYNRISKVVGAFDHARMDSRGVALYGLAALKKRGHKITAPKGGEMRALDAYLNGMEFAQKQARKTIQATRPNAVGDASVSRTTDEIEAYFNAE